MANLDTIIVNVSVSTDSPPVTAANFGVPLFAESAAALNAGFTERLRFYNSAAEASADADLQANAQAAVSAAFAQSPTVNQVAVGRIEADVAQIVTLTYSGTPEIGDTMRVTVNGIQTDYVVASAVLNTEVAALRAALISALAAEDVTVAGADPAITITADNAGEPFTYSSEIILTGSGDLAVGEVLTTANVSIGTELDAILAESASWYGLAIYSRADLQIERAAAWVESNSRIFIAQTDDADVKSAATTDVVSTLAGLSYKRTAVFWHSDDSEFLDFSLLAKTLEADPDLTTTVWGLKNLAGITDDAGSLTATEINNIVGKGGNVYVEALGTPITHPGKMVNGEWIDVITSVDWVTARVRESVLQRLIDESNKNSKIPLTDPGIGVIAGEIQAVLDTGVEAEHFKRDKDDDDNATPFVSSPSASSLTTAQKTARTVPYQFFAELAGAIMTTTINGYVVVEL